MTGHIPVLLHEAIAALRIKNEGHYVDATFGGGGHSKAIADAGGHVIAFDADPEAQKRLGAAYHDRIQVVHANFERIEDVITDMHFMPVQGALFDLGLSSFQLGQAERGFAFMLEGPLDMRFNPNVTSHTAGELLDILPEDGLTDLFLRYGEESHARKIAAKIKQQILRSHNEHFWKHATTKILAELIESIIPRQGKLHPATKVFQALRMAVNDEPGAITRGIDGAAKVIDPRGGRIVVISFHSIEDRIVKQSFDVWGQTGLGHELGTVIMPSEQEVKDNPRSRSAKMRVFEFHS